MIHDDITTLPAFPICIIGAGPAGLTLAKTLAPQKVLLIESGGVNQANLNSDDNAGSCVITGSSKIELAHYLRTSRVRGLGGTSHIWGGHVAPFDRDDFIKNRYRDGWPIQFDTIAPYFNRCDALLKITRPTNTRYRFDKTITHKTYHHRPLRFAEHFRPWLQKTPQTTLISQATVSHLRIDNHRVTGVHIVDKRGQRHLIRCHTCIIAAGAIESTRLLLNSKIENDHLGRYFMDHVHSPLAHLLAPVDKAYDSQNDAFAVLKLATDEKLKYGLNNCYAMIDVRHPRSDVDIGRAEHTLQKLRGNKPTQATVSPLLLFGEQLPKRQSRITRSRQVDRNGIARISLDWQLDKHDIHTLVASAEKIGKHFLASGQGRLQRRCSQQSFMAYTRKHWPHFGACHHMGTTRMAKSVANGVVDPNLQVFGTQNLYVCSSAVFPVSGAANPTYTLLSLAFRLADFLKGQHK